MLKIKDNVDLKELEKYGFEERTYEYTKIYDLREYTIWVSVVKDDPSYNDRYIYIKNDYYDADYDALAPDVMYDLIKDGLVEKVEE